MKDKKIKKEENAVVSGDIAQPMAPNKKIQKRDLGESMKLTPEQIAILKDVSETGETNKWEKIKKVWGRLPSSNDAKNPKLKSDNKRKAADILFNMKENHDKENSNMIQETENYKFYQEGDFKIFEFTNPDDITPFRLGLQKRNYRYWRSASAGPALLEAMRTHRGKNFIIRLNNGEKSTDYNPFAMGM